MIEKHNLNFQINYLVEDPFWLYHTKLTHEELGKSGPFLITKITSYIYGEPEYLNNIIVEGHFIKTPSILFKDVCIIVEDDAESDVQVGFTLENLIKKYYPELFYI